MNKLCNFLCVCLFLTSGNLISQSKADSLENELDSVYIKRYSKNLSLKLNFNNAYHGFSVYDNGNLYADIRPNTSYNNSLSFNYRMFAYSYSFALNFIPGNNDNSIKGETKSKKHEINLILDHLIIGAGYEKIQGFYLENTKDYVANWNESRDGYLILPDLHFYEISTTLGYRFNSNLSLRAHQSQTERQVKSAGSPLIYLHSQFYQADDRTTLTPTSTSQKSNNLQMLFTVGYMYSLVLHRSIFLTAGIHPGAGYINTWLKTRYPAGDVNTSDITFIYGLQSSIGLGLNAEKLFFGGQLDFALINNNQTSSHTIANESLDYQIYLGYRFNSPKLLIKLADKTEEKMNQRPAFLDKKKKSD